VCCPWSSYSVSSPIIRGLLAVRRLAVAPPPRVPAGQRPAPVQRRCLAAGAVPHSAPALAVLRDKAKAVPDGAEMRRSFTHQGVARDSRLAVGHGCGATQVDRTGEESQEALGNQGDSQCHDPERLPQMWQPAHRGDRYGSGGVPRSRGENTDF
jgi:hypothetical protein